MEYIINNISARERIDSCLSEFSKINHMIEGMGHASTPVPFLTRYIIIRASGTIEFSFKAIICDAHGDNQTKQIKQFIDSKFRNSSINPSYENICSGLKDFDKEWNNKFKKNIDSFADKNKILDSLKSLNAARNSFAHGGTPTISFNSTHEYFKDAIKILSALEDAIA
jgi:RiboL-PSP-HEPN